MKSAKINFILLFVLSNLHLTSAPRNSLHDFLLFFIKTLFVFPFDKIYAWVLLFVVLWNITEKAIELRSKMLLHRLNFANSLLIDW